MTAKIKLNAASGGGSFSLQAPSSSSNNRVFTLPDVADTTMATVNGITMVDVWKLTTDFSGNVNPLFSNLVRDTTYSAGVFGTGMSVSSGYWTFPATGIYMVEFHAMHSAFDFSNRYVENFIYVTTDGSNYNEAARGTTAMHDSNSNTHSASHVFYAFDVTNTSTHKVYFRINVANSSVSTHGNSNANRTYMNFKKLADT